MFLIEDYALVILPGGNGNGNGNGNGTPLALAIAQLSTALQVRSDRITNVHLSSLPAFQNRQTPQFTAR